MPALAQETVTYSYDVLGRLTNTARSGGVNNGVNQAYGHDAADNRSSVTVTGSPYANATRIVVVPLKGLFIIPLGQEN